MVAFWKTPLFSCKVLYLRQAKIDFKVTANLKNEFFFVFRNLKATTKTREKETIHVRITCKEPQNDEVTSKVLLMF